MTKRKKSAGSFLEAAYTDLHFDEGDLLSAKESPSKLSADQWVEKGEWLSLAKQVGAEKVFFVNNNPVVIFAKSNGADLEVLRLFNRIWCMARPLLLFIARDNGLSVYNLSQPPVKTVEEWQTTSPLDIVNNVSEVATQLQDYRREQVESGQLFEEKHFGKSDERADQSLIRDLREVRNSLRDAGLEGSNIKYAHALIGRSIFIRYLEDRGILDREYFEEVARAAGHEEWLGMLSAPLAKPVANPETEDAIYPRILGNWDFTYALYDKLAEDFNGDMFPSDPDEQEVVSPQHLELLQGFLRGDTGPQQKLFFWAYRFDIIPVELISSIYEEFYHNEKSESDSSDTKGTHYTRGALVEFVLSQVLTLEQLESNPRILDPACGSGIFLVEAFRRIIRYHVHKLKGRRLNAKQLREILRNQIAGIEINEEAVRIAAFSLYLALLHYQKPRAILKQIKQGMRLPSLKYQEGREADEFHFNILLEADTFRVKLNSTDNAPQLPFMDESTFPGFIDRPVDLIVGNPPWGATDVSDNAIDWCEKRNLPVGDEELSQAFIWKTLDLLQDEGYAGLLVSTGVFFKHQGNSVAFRKRWLLECRLVEIVNFAHVRDVFFPAGIAPFALIFFQKNSSVAPRNSNQLVRYWSAKKTAQINYLQAVILNYSDLKQVLQDDLRTDDKLWKIYWWGNDRDRALINWLELNPSLISLSDKQGSRVISGRGFEVTKKGRIEADWLSEYRQLPTPHFVRYGPLDLNKLAPVPEKVYRRGAREIYEGTRLLVKRGISQKSGPKGRIIARLETEPFCVLNSIHGIRLRDGEEWEYKILLAIFWSSLARYYYFLTSSTWGMWHHEIHLEEIERMPVRLPKNKSQRERIIRIVDQLRDWKSKSPGPRKLKGQFADQDMEQIARLEELLDEAVFELYELNDAERDQIRDMCDSGIEFFYNSFKSQAVEPVLEKPITQGLFKDLEPKERNAAELDNYLEVFLQIWNNELSPSEGEFSWQAVQPEDEWPLLAVVFSTQKRGATIDNLSVTDQQAWFKVLHKLKDSLIVPYNSKRVFIDGMVRAITDVGIIIIKRNERRLWTRSMAREDAEAVMVQAINMQEASRTA
jgi:type I restriction-modification system DNA methylase subunit